MKVCLVHPFAYWLEGYSCGGAEKQVGLLAQHLSRRGHDVTLVTTGHPGFERRVAGVHVRPAWDTARGLRWVRAATYRLPSLRRVIKEVDADLYYLFGTMAYSRWVVEAAHAVGAPAVLRAASDVDLTSGWGRKIAGTGASGALAGHLAWRLLQRRALYTADAIVAQNTAQVALCERMGLPHVLIPSIVEEPPHELLDIAPVYDAVWAGNVFSRARRVKGFDALTSVAEALPDVRFAVLGNLVYPGLAGEHSRLEALPNTRRLGSLPYDGAQLCIAQSLLVLNTSSVEGVSNVMLEGWSLGKPSVTLAVNPSDLLSPRRWPVGGRPAHDFRHALGACAEGDGDLLVRLVEEALSDETSRRAVGERCRDYVASVHCPDAVCARHEELASALRR